MFNKQLSLALNYRTCPRIAAILQSVSSALNGACICLQRLLIGCGMWLVAVLLKRQKGPMLTRFWILRPIINGRIDGVFLHVWITWLTMNTWYRAGLSVPDQASPERYSSWQIFSTESTNAVPRSGASCHDCRPQSSEAVELNVVIAV